MTIFWWCHELNKHKKWIFTSMLSSLSCVFLKIKITRKDHIQVVFNQTTDSEKVFTLKLPYTEVYQMISKENPQYKYDEWKLYFNTKGTLQHLIILGFKVGKKCKVCIHLFGKIIPSLKIMHRKLCWLDMSCFLYIKALAFFAGQNSGVKKTSLHQRLKPRRKIGEDSTKKNRNLP